jgi:peptidase M1-like protein
VSHLASSSLPGARVALTIGLLCLGVHASARGQQPATSYDGVFDELRRIAPRADRVAPVRDLVLQRDIAQFHLAEGRLYLLSDVAGRTIGAAFVGTGDVALWPPLEVERSTMLRILGDSILDDSISAAVFLFADTTLAQLEHGVSFAAGAVDGAVGDRVDDALDFLVDGRLHSVDPTFMAALLNASNNGYFAAYLKRRRGPDVMMVLDPLAVEEVRVLRRGRLEGLRVETVCQFQRVEDLAHSVAAGTKRPDPLQVDAYRIDARIGGSYDFSARAAVRFTARRDDGPWVPFVLFSELEVDSVLNGGGTPLTFSRTRGNNALWVREDHPLHEHESDSIQVVYHGPLIEYGSVIAGSVPSWWSQEGRHLPPMLDNWAFIKSTWSWFPRYGATEPATMDMIFHTPRDLRFASIGRLADSHTERNQEVSHWISEGPTSVASFNIGPFEEFRIRDPRIPPVTVHFNKRAHDYVRELLPHAARSQEQVGADIANSLSFFTTTYGPPLFQSYYATEIPYSHGQAFPGLIHLSWWTFVGLDQDGSDEAFRAHEMAHQWWGIGVEPATYRDWWLSEGFAEFSGLWYMQFALHDNDTYFRRLRESRQEIRRQREHAAPIGLGPRANEDPSGHYDLMVYQKGAWVLQMLRNLMLDTRTMSDERFGAMMRDFYQTYRGRRASTQDFQRVVEQHINGPMDWFFREWVDGTAIPTYTVSWHSEPLEGGRFLLRYRVRQEDVPDDFRMIVPMMIEFGEDRSAIVRVNIQGTVSEGRLTLPAEPRRVVLNPLESVLAEVREEHWQ